MKKILALLMLILVTAGCSPKIDNIPHGREFNLTCQENESSVQSRGDRGYPARDVSRHNLIKGSRGITKQRTGDKVVWEINRIVITENIPSRIRENQKKVTQIKKDDLTYKKTHYLGEKVNFYENGQCFLNLVY